MNARLRDSFWTGQTAQALAGHPEAGAIKLVALYLVTGPLANPYGLYTLDLAVTALHTSLTLPRVESSLAALSVLDYAHHRAGWVWVVEMAGYQLGAPLKPTDWRVTNLARWYASLPPHVPFLGPFWDRYRRDLCLEGRVERRVGTPKAVSTPAPEVTDPPGQSLVLVPPPARRAERHRPVAPEDADLRQWFDTVFWPAYPRRTHRQAAWEAVRKLRPDEPLRRTILAAIAHQRDTIWADAELAKIPHAGTWINGQRWTDEIAPRPVRSKRAVAAEAAMADFLGVGRHER
ncbi:MAG: hypothetical protein QN178_14005 [Armatimonadota bacterium]|nr:hypothetical protein [Armatimonadota bacterium]